MASVGAFEAKTHLSDLLDRVARGEKITITRHGVPAALLVPVEEKKAELTHREIVEGMRALRKRVKPGKMSVREMVNEADAFSAERRGQRLSVPTGEELAELARRLNAMLQRPESAWVDRFEPVPELERYVVRNRIPAVHGEHGSWTAWIHLRPLSLNFWLRRSLQ